LKLFVIVAQQSKGYYQGLATTIVQLCGFPERVLLHSAHTNQTVYAVEFFTSTVAIGGPACEES
jgi:hypothetical protein